jgi:predicted Mrr-cat superfamily restriction endonuclease
MEEYIDNLDNERMVIKGHITIHPNINTQQEKTEQAEKNPKEKQSNADDKSIYTYCGVLLKFSKRPYSFRTEDETIKIGDRVIVPVGDDEEKMIGVVASIIKYTEAAVPYPLQKTKFIIKKVD